MANPTIVRSRLYHSCIGMCRLAALISMFLMMISLGYSTANADSHGICFSHDYDDNGERYCDNFHTMEDIRQRHIRLREFCKKDKNTSNCEPIQYIRNGERYFYHSIKVCYDREERSKSRFFLVTDAGFEFQGKSDQIIVNEQENHDGSCLENRKKFDEYIRNDQIYFYSQNGVLLYGGIMPNN